MKKKTTDIKQLGPMESRIRKVQLDPDEGIIEHIHKGGQGDEAVVMVELRTVIPGIRQVIKTKEGIVTAVRREKYPKPGLGHTMFLRNMLIKKLDDFFTWTGIYTYSHIPRAFGSIGIEGKQPSETCIYEWFAGEEGFPWKKKDTNDKLNDVILHDWEIFVDRFQEAGIILGEDCYDLRNKHFSKNIIHQFPFFNIDSFYLNVIWKRIDFGDGSMSIDLEKCADYLHRHQHQLKENLRPERFDMLELTVQYLLNKNILTEYDLKLLMKYIQDYRVKSVDHYISHGTSLGGQLLYLDDNESLMQVL